jgi:transposase InsO family protein
MYRDIRKWVNSCELCAKRKPYQPTNHGLLQPIKATYPFEVVGIDIVGPFSRSKKEYKYILVCVDLFTNWIELALMKAICAEEFSELVFKNIITRHGCLTHILTDQGTQFTSDMFQDLCKRFKIQKIEASAYHPQTNDYAKDLSRAWEQSFKKPTCNVCVNTITGS